MISKYYLNISLLQNRYCCRVFE